MARFTNQAQLRYGNSVANSNIAVGEILEVLSASKTAVRDSYAAGDTITYVISILNSGATAINGLTVTDNLGTYTFGATTKAPLSYVDGSIKYYVNGVLQNAPALTTAPSLVITGISIPAEGNAILVYEALINEFAPLGIEGVITNQVTISGDGLITPIETEESVYAEIAPLLGITKSVSPVPVTENGTLTYAFQIQNNGNAAADEATGIVVTDDFDPLLTNLTVTYNGTVLVEGTDYTYDVQTGAFATIAGKITVPAASFTQDIESGVWMTTPGSASLIVTGTI